MTNPFLAGIPVPSEQFLNRQSALRAVVGRIINQGQSTALVGDPRIGKSSVLQYLAAPENLKPLYGELSDTLFFSSIDAMTLPPTFTPAQFWQHAIKPLAAKIEIGGAPEEIKRTYSNCKEDGYSNLTLDVFFKSLKTANWRLAVLIDEFDVILNHALLNSTEFYGGLRSLSSLSRGGLAIVIATRQSLTILNRKTQAINTTGSPYFNIFYECIIGGFPDSATEQLLALGTEKFSAEDQTFIKHLAGGHPFLLQSLASELWNQYEYGETDPVQRRKQAASNLYTGIEHTISNTWLHWTPEIKKVFATITLAQIPTLLHGKDFDISNMVKELPAYGSELNALKKRGYIVEDSNAVTGWVVLPKIFTIWLTGELKRALEVGDDLGGWLDNNTWRGLLKDNEKRQLLKALKKAGGWLVNGTETFIQAAAKGWAEGMVGK